MTTLHEQARAEQRREYGSVWDVLVPEVGRTVGWIIDGVIDDVVAARTRVVTTVAELDALPLGSVVLDADGDVWQMRERGLIPGSEWACTERAIPMSTGAALANAPFAPFRVLYEPEEGR